MQIEKHIKIVPTPTGAVVFFAGQVCLSVNEHSGRYTWSISPVFARLTTGIANCFQVPMASWDGQETLAEAIADGLTKLDEMQAFYGVIDIPEDTYVGEHLDEGTDYSGIHADVKRTGKTHEQLAAEHRAYAKQMRLQGQDGLAVRSEMLANSHDKYIKFIASLKKTNESVEDEDLLIESFVVRQVGKSRTQPARIMISAAAVINRAREMAKEAGEKTHAKFIKLAHAEIASNMKAESEEIEGAQIEEGFGDIVKGIKRKFHGKLPAKEVEHDYARSARSAIKHGTDAQADKAIDRYVRVSKVVSPDAFPPGYKAPKRASNEEFIQYEDALPGAFQSIKEDCRIEALAMSDSLLEAQQLANELFEDIVEEYLNSLFEVTHQELLDGAQKAYVEATRKGNGVMARHYGQEILRHKATIAARAKKVKLKEEVEELDEAESVQIHSPGNKLHGKTARVFFKHPNGAVNVQVQHSGRKGDVTNLTLKPDQFKSIEEEVELDEAALSGDAYWKSKEAESKEEFLKAQRKALGLPEPVKRGRGKPTLIDRDLLKTRAHSNVEAGKRPTAGFDRNEKIHFVRHLKDHPDFADKHVSQAGRPTGTTKVAKQQKELAKKKQDSAFSMWAGLGKR